MREKTSKGATGSLMGKINKTVQKIKKDRRQIANHKNQCHYKSFKDQYQYQAQILANHTD